jgi:hypothetical protein
MSANQAAQAIVRFRVLGAFTALLAEIVLPFGSTPIRTKIDRGLLIQAKDDHLLRRIDGARCVADRAPGGSGPEIGDDCSIPSGSSEAERTQHFYPSKSRGLLMPRPPRFRTCV